jgi:hypothetical protein
LSATFAVLILVLNLPPNRHANPTDNAHRDDVRAGNA